MSDFTIQFGRLVSYQGKDECIVIPDNVTAIGRRAFYFKKIRNVTLPPAVTEIEEEAFTFTDLEQVTICGRVKKVGKDAFGAYGCDLKLRPYVYGKIPIRSFSKSNQFEAARFFISYEDRSVFDADVNEANLVFLAKNMLMTSPISRETIYSLLESNESLLQIILERGLIPAAKMEPLLEYALNQNSTAVAAALMQYKNRIKRPQEKDLLSDISVSVADWRKQFKFRYENDGITITGCKVRDDDVIVPAMIGSRPVRKIGTKAFVGSEMTYREAYCNEEELLHKRKIIISSGIAEIQRGAFFALKNMEIILPDTVTSLEDGIFVAASYLVVHIPAAVTKIGNEIVWDSAEKALTIVAPSGSFAEQYAKEHNVPFAVEQEI